MIESHWADGCATIVLRPNRSWTWRANRYLLYTLMTVSGVIALSFTARGLWLVLPFTVVEMAALLACLWYCVRRTRRQEVLRLSADELVLEKGRDRPEATFRCPRFFARFRVEAPRHPWYSARIHLETREAQHAIGEFLTQEEKRALIREVRGVIHRLEAGPHDARRATT